MNKPTRSAHQTEFARQSVHEAVPSAAARGEAREESVDECAWIHW